MSREADFYLKTGDTNPSLEAELLDGTEEPIDLTDTTVRFAMREYGADELIVDDPATIVDATAGVVKYSWSTTDTQQAGYYQGEFRVDYSGATGADFATDETFPNGDYVVVRIVESL